MRIKVLTPGVSPQRCQAETGILLLNNQRQHRTSHAPKDVLPLRICTNYRAPFQPMRIKVCTPWRFPTKVPGTFCPGTSQNMSGTNSGGCFSEDVPPSLSRSKT